MNTHDKTFTLRASVVAVQGALVAIGLLPAARAADPLDPAVAALVEPSNSIETGVGVVSANSFKANEYNGLSGKGSYWVGNFDLRSGPFGSEDPARVRLTGRNLGTDARSLNIDLQLNSSVKAYFGYDELQRNRSDTYQSPLLGAGTSVLTLPGNWAVPVAPRLSATAPNARGLSPDVTSSSALVTGVLTAPTAAQLAAAATLQTSDLPAFQNVDLYTKRTRFDVGVTLGLDRYWEMNASFRHEDKVGLKPMGTITRATGGDISTIIPDLIDQATEQINLGLKYHADKLTVQGAYYGSVFTNNVPSMTWSNWASPGNAQTMSSAPANQFHQFGLTGAYTFSPTTRLVANGSYARTTQNDTFLTATYTPLVPVNSLSGLVVSKALNLKLTSRPMKDLSLNATYKLDDRDNRTAVNTYGFYDAGEAAAGTSPFAALYPGLALGANSNLNANRSYSKKLNQLNLEGDYAVAPGQNVKAGFDTQNIDRYCNGSWIACADASTTKEDTLRAEWRARAWETLTARVSGAHSSRKVDYNEDAWLALVPPANWAPTGAANYNAAYGTAYSTLVALGLTGYGPISGLNPLPTPLTAAAFFFPNNNALPNALYGNQNRISELPGMRRYNMADRKRDKLRIAVDWQATEQFTLQAGLDLNRDDYAHSIFGLQQGKSYALNLDGSYALSDTGSLNAFVTHEDQRSRSAGNTYTANSTAANVNGATAISGGCFATIAERNASNKVDPCLNWTADMRDKVDTLGAAFTQRDLMGGKVDITAGLSFSRARSASDVTGGNYVNNPLAVAGAPAGTIAAFYIPATSLPVVTTNTTELKLSTKYALNKESAVRVGYIYQYMKSSDWMYEGMQFGGLAGVLPTNEQAPNYTVHTIVVTYLYTFR